MIHFSIPNYRPVELLGPQQRLALVQAALAAFAPPRPEAEQQQQLEPQRPQLKEYIENPPLKEGEYRAHPTMRALADEERLQDDPWRQVPHCILSFSPRHMTLKKIWWDEAGNRTTVFTTVALKQLLEIRYIYPRMFDRNPQLPQSARNRLIFVFAKQEVNPRRNPAQTLPLKPSTTSAMAFYMSEETQQRLFADLEAAYVLLPPWANLEGLVIRSGRAFWNAKQEVKRVKATAARLSTIGEENEEEEAAEE